MMQTMNTIAIANHKGGVGKTATVQALGTALAADHGRRVLLVDADPQASLTGACGLEAEAADASLAEVMGTATPGSLALRDVIHELGTRLHLVPADLSLAASELGLVARIGRENVLRQALTAVAGGYDVCLIDCPPSLGLMTVNALTAADAVLIPTQPQIVDLRGLRLFLDTLGQIRQGLNPELETLGILVTFFDRRLIHHRGALETMEAADLPLLPVRIGRSIRVAEAATRGEAVTTYAPRNPQAKAYRRLGEAVEIWLSEHRRNGKTRPR